MGKPERKLTPSQIAVIEKTVNAGDRIEVVPTKDGIKLYRMKKMEFESAECGDK